MPGTLTIEALLKYWEVSMIVVSIVVSLNLATIAVLKKNFKVKGRTILYVSSVTTLVWTLAMIVSIPGVSVKGIVATWIVSYITASGGWQVFKDVLQKTSENFGKK